jgi:hypothetical protein
MTRCVHSFLCTVAIAFSACIADDVAVQTDEHDIALAPSCSPPVDDACIPGELRDTSPAPGIQPDCAVSVFLRGEDEPLEYIVPPCKLTGGREPCYQAVLDRDACPRTPTGLRMVVRHAWGDDVLATDVECVPARH